MNDQTLPASLDGQGAGDHDEPYSGYKTYQFSSRQHARLLLLRGKILEARLGYGPLAEDLAAASA